ncbi:hypothetical protein ALC62_00178 [Cyphomyrmex costatus]|uniref:Uncharacterized protein n=1 Tax=Cyphomyrmex costatus TaxID=456900 RepID=A0A151K203_9HYME|nr:hypothetical protein ALC62_13760 [Cyphomyrmex costatus]KYN50150.1 hypothetical protein ALC62_00178 [Cyphomyrmex costatus]
MAKRHKRASLRLAHRSAAMSIVCRTATMKRMTGRQLWYVPLDHDDSGILRDIFDCPDDERCGSRDVGLYKFPRFNRDARELQSLPPYFPSRPLAPVRSTYKIGGGTSAFERKKCNSNRNPTNTGQRGLAYDASTMNC